eukprot:3254531-Prymnesium_polylepis.1
MAGNVTGAVRNLRRQGSSASEASAKATKSTEMINGAVDQDRTPLLGITPVSYFECSVYQGGVSLSDDVGSMLAIGGNQVVSVYSIANGGAIRQMERAGRVRCVSLSRDGSILIAGGFDKKVTLTLVECGAQMYSYCGTAGAIVRSVHMAQDSGRLAVGMELGGKGYVELYDLQSDVRVCQLEHPKAIWCVRLSPDGRTLLTGGFDMKCTVYDTTTDTCDVIQQISYTPKAGPAFIWSMAWSQNGNYAVVGCWNRSVYLYSTRKQAKSLWRFTSTSKAAAAKAKSAAAAAGEEGHAAVNLMEVAEVCRSDRVYAVALSETGRFIAVGGRDKAVALYDAKRRIKHAEKAPPSPASSFKKNREGREGDEEEDAELSEEVPIVWEHITDDFIYTVALTPDLQ